MIWQKLEGTHFLLLNCLTYFDYDRIWYLGVRSDRFNMRPFRMFWQPNDWWIDLMSILDACQQNVAIYLRVWARAIKHLS